MGSKEAKRRIARNDQKKDERVARLTPHPSYYTREVNEEMRSYWYGFEDSECVAGPWQTANRANKWIRRVSGS